MQDFKIFTGSAHPNFSKDVADNLNITLAEAEISRFSDGEISIRLCESVRGKDVFVIQPTCAPANDNLMELFIIIDALKRSSVNCINVIMPYFGYARQDRKAEPRVPITAKLVADLLQRAGITRLVTMDLHAGQIQGFFDIPVDNLYGSVIFQDYIRSKNLQNAIIASPDIGGVARARYFAKLLGLEIVLIDKRREIGNVRDKNVILIDDIIDTAGTMVKAASAFKEKGATSVIALGTHAVFSGEAYEKIEKSQIDEVIVTDTIPLKIASPKIKVLSVAPLFAEVIRRINKNESVNSLFI